MSHLVLKLIKFIELIIDLLLTTNIKTHNPPFQMIPTKSPKGSIQLYMPNYVCILQHPDEKPHLKNKVAIFTSAPLDHNKYIYAEFFNENQVTVSHYMTRIERNRLIDRFEKANGYQIINQVYALCYGINPLMAKN